ncbi:MAG: LAGLIDADG family homing endonuclease [Candidatus Paceibacterota bacterium]
MAESFNTKRLQFTNAEEQKAFMCNVKNASGDTWQKLALKIGVSTRTLTDWARAKYSISADGYRKLKNVTGVQAHAATEVDVTERLKRAGRAGGCAKIAKYGQLCDEEYRKRCWYEWWEREGKHKESNTKITRPRTVVVPQRCEALAEFIGIMIGDGSIAKYHARVSLDAKVDRQYADYVTWLVQKLFEYDPGILYRTNSRSLDVVMYRSAISSFLHKQGLPWGNKIAQGIDIPHWIKRRKSYARACLRGLIDTDGSLFRHSYISAGKRYEYPKMSFTSHSPSLITSVQQLLRNEGIYARITASCRDVRLEKRKDVVTYFSVCGTNNPKNKKKKRTMKI